MCPDPDTHYRTTKILAENMLDPKIDLIWRIPRVYSLDRSRGLIPQLKNNSMPRPDAKLRWVKLEDFVRDFLGSLDGVGYRTYRGPQQYTKVKDILKVLGN